MAVIVMALTIGVLTWAGTLNPALSCAVGSASLCILGVLDGIHARLKRIDEKMNKEG